MEPVTSLRLITRKLQILAAATGIGPIKSVLLALKVLYSMLIKYVFLLLINAKLSTVKLEPVLHASKVMT